MWTRPIPLPATPRPVSSLPPATLLTATLPTLPPLPYRHISDSICVPRMVIQLNSTDAYIARIMIHTRLTEPLGGSVYTCKELNKPRIVHEQLV